MGKIYCKKCKTYLGNIEGNIRKDIVYLCKKCNTQREALELKYKEDRFNTGSTDIGDILNIFKGGL